MNTAVKSCSWTEWKREEYVGASGGGLPTSDVVRMWAQRIERRVKMKDLRSTRRG